MDNESCCAKCGVPWVEHDCSGADQCKLCGLCRENECCKCLEELKLLREVGEASDAVFHNLQSMPWSNNESGDHVCITKDRWKLWNYRDCGDFFDALEKWKEWQNGSND